MSAFLNHAQIELGARNMARVEEWQRSHPWGTQSECAADLGLSIMAVNRHVKTLRDEWRKIARLSA